MLVKRFGFAKITRGTIETPSIMKVGKDIKMEGNRVIILDREIKRDILYPPSIEQHTVELMPNFYLIPNISDMLRDTKEFVRYTINLRENLGYGAIFYAPGVEPHLIPALVYLGYDVFDDSREKIDAYSLIGKISQTYRPEDFSFTEFILNQTKIALENGKLRELVEGIADNKGKEILRILDLQYYPQVERFYPVWMPHLDAVSHDSLYRPDIRRYLQRLKERYRKPEYARYLLLLPCSAKKPYSLSRSHREMRMHIKSTMHEVIVTSPLGLVPRELESIYPARNYDIPVIGHWYEEEKKMIRDMLSWYLEKFKYEAIISYLPESMKFLEDVLKEYGAEMLWGKNLEDLSRQTKSLGYHVPRDKIYIENFKTLAKFQFGCCQDRMKDVKIRGRFPRVNLWIRGKRIFGYNPEKGMLTLTEESAQWLMEEKKYIVHIDDFYPEGDIFAMGILDASPEIREEDEVVVSHEGELRGWGIARMCAYDMVHEKKGKSVKIRGKIKV